MSWNEKRKNYEPYYKNKLESALLYQDFIVDFCWQTIGLAIVQYSSKAYQQSVGETRTGVEIKFDQMLEKTGNLWIELEEKSYPDRPGPYVPSGIFRGDNAWLYLIGNYDEIFIFSKKFLQCLSQTDRVKVIENRTKTSRGFLLSRSLAIKYSSIVLYPKAQEKIGKLEKDLLEQGSEFHRIALSSLIDKNQGTLFDNIDQYRE